MFPRAIRVLRLGGIDVRIDPSWFLIAGLVVLSFLSRWGQRFGTSAALWMAGAATVLFFASLLVHELGHALEARHRDIHVDGITLFLLGGVTEMHGEAKRPRDEFVVAAVGPFLSLVLGAFFGICYSVVDFWTSTPTVENVLGLLAWVNIGLAIFNLVPGAPLDGGRIVRAGLWALLGDRRSAMAWAARLGQAFALALALFAVRGILLGAITDGLWLSFVAWFLWRGAQAERRHAALERLLAGERAGALDVEVSEPVGADLSLEVVTARLGPDAVTGVRPVDRDGQVVGALVLDEVARMHPQDVVFRSAADVMHPAGDLPVLAADMPVRDVLHLFQRQPLALLQLDDGRTTTLTAQQFGEALERLRRRRRGLPLQPEAPVGPQAGAP